MRWQGWISWTASEVGAALVSIEVSTGVSLRPARTRVGLPGLFDVDRRAFVPDEHVTWVV